MTLRRVLKFNGSLGLTLPVTLHKTLGLHWKDYVEVYFVGPDKIVIKRHKQPDDLGVKNE